LAVVPRWWCVGRVVTLLIIVPPLASVVLIMVVERGPLLVTVLTEQVGVMEAAGAIPFAHDVIDDLLRFSGLNSAILDLYVGGWDGYGHDLGEYPSVYSPRREFPASELARN
jgi:hypothetical protein